MKEPNIGDTIKATYPDSEETGVVEWVGASQFTFVREDGQTRFCMFQGVWEIIKKRSSETLSKPDLKQKARDLYEEYQNYAAVARELGLHPTTIRTWLKK